jgi:hypothetical protein
MFGLMTMKTRQYSANLKQRLILVLYVLEGCKKDKPKRPP